MVRQQVDDPAEVDVEGGSGPRHALIQTDAAAAVDLRVRRIVTGATFRTAARR